MANGKQRITDIISTKEISTWREDTPVVIEAATGAGKSYFIKNVLYQYAKEHNEKILMLIHRKNCIRQFQKEIEDNKKQGIIHIMSYQLIENYELDSKKNSIDLSKYKYIVCDEFHYFLQDSKFNNATDISLNRIMEQNAIKIMMSATSFEIRRFIESEYCKVKSYEIERDWSFISKLYFTYEDNGAEIFARKMIEDNQKCIIFLSSAKEAYSLFKKLKNKALFCCSEYNSQYSKYVDKNKIKKMLKNECFTEQILITTSCLDAGINIIDTELHNIYIDIDDIDSLIQCIGRKRIQNEDDTLNVYIHAINNNKLGGMITNTKKSIEMAEYLLNHTTSEYIIKYPKRFDPYGIVYDEKLADGTIDKKVNKLMLEKRIADLVYHQYMLKLKELGYCKYMAQLLGKFDIGNAQYDFELFKDEDKNLSKYLAKMVGKPMYNVPDRTPLIKRIGLKSNDRHLLKSRDSLNESFKECGVPYIIDEYATSITINGKRKQFRHVWEVKEHQWD